MKWQKIILIDETILKLSISKADLNMSKQAIPELILSTTLNRTSTLETKSTASLVLGDGVDARQRRLHPPVHRVRRSGEGVEELASVGDEADAKGQSRSRSRRALK